MLNFTQQTVIIKSIAYLCSFAQRAPNNNKGGMYSSFNFIFFVRAVTRLVMFFTEEIWWKIIFNFCVIFQVLFYCILETFSYFEQCFEFYTHVFFMICVQGPKSNLSECYSVSLQLWCNTVLLLMNLHLIFNLKLL